MIHNKLSIDGSEVVGTDLCLNKLSHLTDEFKRKSYYIILILCYNL